MLEERSAKILDAVIRQFIKKGEPVSSEELYDSYDFGIKPASIRAELLRLTNDGLLSQPHTSGGRIPTEHAYQMWLDRAIDDLFDVKKNLFARGIVGSMLRHFGQSDMHDLIDEVAGELKTLTVGYEPKQEEVYKSGFDGLCEKIDFESRSDFLEVVRDFEGLDEKLSRIYASLPSKSQPLVFVGQNSPITKSKHLIVIADRYEMDGEPFYLIAIGPKRMDYRKTLKLFKGLKGK